MTLAITYNKGFHIKFPNGYKVSVQFGAYNYCEGYNKGSDHLVRRAEEIRKSDYIESPDAETALIAPNGNFIPYKDSDVQGYMTPTDILELLNYASQLPSIERAEYYLVKHKIDAFEYELELIQDLLTAYKALREAVIVLPDDAEYQDDDWVYLGGTAGYIRMPSENNNFTEPMVHFVRSNEMVRARGAVIAKRNGKPVVKESTLKGAI